MIYQSVSMKSVIGRIIRNTRVQDTSYIADMHDWLFEAMGMLETRQTTSGRAEDVTISFHKGKLPCGLRWLDAVEYNGCRLHRGNSVRPVSREVVLNDTSGISIFDTKVDKVVPVENHLLWRTTLESLSAKPLSVGNFYDTEMGYITTSMCDALVTIYGRFMPVDEDGLPLIPDNENYKQALYWYVRAMMIGAGYPDSVFKYEHCIQQFEHVYAPRAIGEITYPSLDEMESMKNTMVRFIPPQNYWENFFRTDAEGFYDTYRM